MTDYTPSPFRLKLLRRLADGEAWNDLDLAAGFPAWDRKKMSHAGLVSQTNKALEELQQHGLVWHTRENGTSRYASRWDRMRARITEDGLAFLARLDAKGQQDVGPGGD